MNWLSQNTDLVFDLTLTHLRLSIPPILLSLVLAIAIGYLAHRQRFARGPVLTLTGLLYAVPSLPLFIMIPVVFGTPLRSGSTMIIALTIYGVALLVRSAADAFGSVDRSVHETANAVGFSPWARFWRVELPLAGPVLLAGLRVVAVSTVSLVTVGAVIGIQSLGTLFTDGFQRGIQAEIFTGVILTILVGYLLDTACVWTGRLLMPWTRPRPRTNSRAPLHVPADVAGGAR
ncbi:MAG: transporter permease [Thermoleophilia bacterium]|nr:transporter permease [Thermoleophilia bacterium]